MANNTTLPGTGDVIADEDISGVKYQLVKLVDGTAAGTGRIGGDATNGLDVDVTRVTGTVTVAGAVTLASTTVTGTVAVTDNSGSLTVDAPVGTPAFVRLSDGSAAITTLPVSLATAPSTAVTNVGTFAVQSTIAAGATNIAKAEDVASADADVGVPSLAVRKAAPANTSGTDGDYEFLQMSAGRLWASANVDQINGVTPLMGNGATGTGSIRVTIANDNTAIPVASHAVTNAGTFAVQLAANQSVNNAQINGVTPLMGNGVSGTGAQRVTLASDGTGQVTLAAGAATIGALTANQSTNIAQMNGVATTMGNGVSGTGVQRVSIASDSTGILAGVTTVTTLSTLTGGAVAEDAAISGNPLRIGGRASKARPTAMSADNDFVSPWFDLAGALHTVPGAATTATLANVSSSATNVTLIASNTSRKGAVVHNDSTQIVYLKYGATATSSSYTYKLAAGDHWEMPSPIYTGIVDGIWVSANGSARTTEMT